MLSESSCTKLYLKYKSDLVKVLTLLYLTLFNDTKSSAMLITSKPSTKSLCVCRKDKALNLGGVMLDRSLVLILLAIENDLSGVALVAGFMGSSSIAIITFRNNNLVSDVVSSIAFKMPSTWLTFSLKNLFKN